MLSQIIPNNVVTSRKYVFVPITHTQVTKSFMARKRGTYSTKYKDKKLYIIVPCYNSILRLVHLMGKGMRKYPLCLLKDYIISYCGFNGRAYDPVAIYSLCCFCGANSFKVRRK